MGDTTPTPPAPTPGEPNPPSPPSRPDARAFFRQYYGRLDQVPIRPADPEIRAFEERNGPHTGYTRKELTEIALSVRAALRQERRNQPGPGPDQPAKDPRAWERWIRR